MLLHPGAFLRYMESAQIREVRAERDAGFAGGFTITPRRYCARLLFAARYHEIENERRQYELYGQTHFPAGNDDSVRARHE
ncbi:hypothetical protein SAMN05216417_101272 [Nitrosospira multiformis]|uniref:Uncharacterized protein n=1 Tax=Nitrosospira multiformis TaxID=1231 RepID=A0A1I7F9S0_9PROT|nr:hypothetical protein SAMN05216417_101272 [Nitrosospira multiformis]